MTRGEILTAMEELIDELWDSRNWQLALATTNPVENYNKAKEESRQAEKGTPIDELTKTEKDWLRST